MNRTAIRNFATGARTMLIEQVRSRLQMFGIDQKGMARSQEVTGGLMVNGLTLNEEEGKYYQDLMALIDRYRKGGDNHQMAIAKVTDEIAYIWFNRLVALRFMEVNGYLGYWCLGCNDPALKDTKAPDPDLLREVGAIAAAGDFAGFDLGKLTEWREVAALQPNPEEWLYRKLLLLQCGDLAAAIPFLFEHQKDFTILFLPPNLLNSDSILRKLINEIAEVDWQDIEIVGWLYQFYISERKDEVIGAKSKVSAEDIPAATQLFTPHWIVRYMVENSLGRLWLESHPESGLREKMPYFLEKDPHPLAPSPMKGEGGQDLSSPLAPLSLHGRGAGGEGLLPTDLTLCDPACGSGHILVYAFDLLFEIYKEQGYADREIPALILEHNLFGLDIDDRAMQLASFAVLMKARAKNSRILRKPLRLNIVHVRNTRRFFSEADAAIAQSISQTPLASHQLALDGFGMAEQLPLMVEVREQIELSSLSAIIRDGAEVSEGLRSLLAAFLDADHLGSLIVPPLFDADRVYAEIDRLEVRFAVLGSAGDWGLVRDVVRVASFLQQKYRVVVANPPYMGDGSFNDVVKAFVNKNYKDAKGDLYGAFILRDLQLCAVNGSVAMLTIPNWMFLSSFEGVRKFILANYFLENLVHNGRGVFGSDFGSCSFTIRNRLSNGELGTFKRLFEKQGSVASNEELEQRFFTSQNFYTNPQDLSKIPGSAIAYWVSDKILNTFQSSKTLNEISSIRQGLATADNDRFLRYWSEIEIEKIGFNLNNLTEAKVSKKKWFPYNKGGDFRRWYGNQEYVVNWENDGYEIRNFGLSEGTKIKSRPQNVEAYFRESISWSKVTSSIFSLRYFPQGFIFADAGMSIFFEKGNNMKLILGLMNSPIMTATISSISPTLNFEVGQISNFPVIKDIDKEEVEVNAIADSLIAISRQDWDNFETSWDFKTHPLTHQKTDLIQQAFENWEKETESAFQELKRLEEENNRYWIAAYGLQDELTPEVPDAQITIRRADLVRDIKSLLSYAVGCMMGRYELGQEGLVFAGKDPHPLAPSPMKGEGGQDPINPTLTPLSLNGRGAGGEGILPITDRPYFPDDIITHLIDFLKNAYGSDRLQENLDYIANALTLRSDETATDRIRRYFLDEFVKDHIQTYKKRPIYWYFTSGKKKAFGALVYLHSYNPDTLGKLRTEYVLELQQKRDREIQQETKNLDNLTTTALKKATQKRLKELQEQQIELREYQARLQHAADKRIDLDLDDGVAYNYTLFEGLVYEGADLKMADLKKKSEWKKK